MVVYRPCLLLCECVDLWFKTGVLLVVVVVYRPCLLLCECVDLWLKTNVLLFVVCLLERPCLTWCSS